MDNPADLVIDFVNTYDVESDADSIPTPAALTAWLGGRGLIRPGAVAGETDLATATDLREGLRAALRHNHDRPGGTNDHGAGLSRAFAALPLRVALTADGPVLEPVVTGVLGGLAEIAAAVMSTHACGMWPRLKVCTESTCQWAFVDSSKNRSRSWCSMRVCGNRTKTRAYRARRQTEPGSRHL
ncbi:CGNR zinc finger domain-containing protein [Streptosporangium amethystogenes]|uniref:CGNR zinc finger domain-containing protein n=1 Tax=Streptosporangium amethystogenes TaxID=2002 RepID=UPI0004CB310A|nr:CGNR zinc finger domain-containing protein [Streptosporangium amethystogenes]